MSPPLTSKDRRTQAAQAFKRCLEIGVGRADQDNWQHVPFADSLREARIGQLSGEMVRSLASAKRDFKEVTGRKVFLGLTQRPSTGERRTALLAFLHAYRRAYPTHPDDDISGWVAAAGQDTVPLAPDRDGPSTRPPTPKHEPGPPHEKPVSNPADARPHRRIYTLHIAAPFAGLVGLTAGLVAGWSWWQAIVVLGFFAWYLLLESLQNDQASQRYLLRFIRLDLYKRSYRVTLGGCLNVTDRWFLSPNQVNALPLTSARRAWTLRLYARVVLLAALYPIVSVLLQWGFTTNDVTIGRTITARSDAAGHVRIGVLVFYAASISLSAWAYGMAHGAKRRWVIAGAILLAFAALGIGRDYGFVTTTTTGLAVVLALISAMRGINALAAFVASAACGGATIAFAGPQIQALADALSPWFSMLSGKQLNDVLSSGTNAVVTIMLSLLLLPVFKRFAEEPNALGRAAYVLVSIGSVILLAVATGSNPMWSLYYIFAGIIPLINAGFDFASIGLTRWALRQGMRKVGWRTLLFSLVDLIAAFAIFLMLGCFSIIVLHIVNVLSATPGSPFGMVPLHGPDSLFAYLAILPGNHIWLYITFLTTLLPTVVHFMIAVWAVGPTLLTPRLRRRLTLQISRGADSVFARVVVLSVLSGWCIFACIVPVYVIVSALRAVFGTYCEFGHGLLEAFKAFYTLLSGVDQTLPNLPCAA